MRRSLAILVTAIVALTIGCAKSPHSSSVKIYLQQNQIDKAIREGKAWVADEPNNPEAYFWLAQAYMKNGQYVEAADELDKAMELDKEGKVFKKFSEPEKVTYMNAGLIVKDTNRSRAIHYFQQAYRIDSTDVKVLMTLAAFYGMDKDYQKMLDYLKRAEAIAPDDPEVLYRMAIAYEQIDDYANAEKYLKKALEIDSTLAKAHYEYGVVLFNEEAFDLAAQEFKKAYELDTTDLAALFNWMQALIKGGKYEEAIEVARLYTQKKPDDPNGWFYLGSMLLTYKENPSKEELKESVEALSKAIELKPDDPTYYDIRATAYAKLGETEKAKADLDKAKSLRKE